MTMSLNIKKSKLDNGLTIVKVNLPNFHSILNFLVVRSGSRYETPEINGIAHFLEHMVFKGTKSYANTKEISEAVEGVGGYFNAWTANDHTAYWNIVPQDQWQLGIKMPSELAFYPTLPAPDLERERGVIIEEIRRMNDDPSSLVQDLIGEILYPESTLGYSIIGTEKNIQEMSIEDFRAYHKKHYQPNQAYFICVGNLEDKDIDAEIAKNLGELKMGERSEFKPVTTPSKKGLVVKDKDTDQTHFVLAVADPCLKYKSEDLYAAAVLNTVLGDGMSSRLFLNIREKKGLAYSIHSEMQSFEDTGLIQITGGVNTGKINLTLEALEEELTKLRSELVSEVELKKAKAKITGSYDLSSDRQLDIARWYGVARMLGDDTTIESSKEKIEKVTAEQVKAIAEKLLIKDRQCLSVIGPFKDDKKFKEFLQLD